MLNIDPNISIFVQLADYLRLQIFSGTLKPGEKLLSIREMAIELEVNPNTIKRVYQELIDDYLINTHGTLGNFVSEDLELIENKKKLYLINKTKVFINLVQELNVDVSSVVKQVMGGQNGKTD